MSLNYHNDPEVNGAIIRLLDALCQWERDTGNGSNLIIMPSEDRIIIAQDGKPIEISSFHFDFIVRVMREASGL